MRDTQTAISALPDADVEKANLQTALDNFKNKSPYGTVGHYSFSFNTNLAAAGGNPLTFRYSIEARKDLRPIRSESTTVTTTPN